MKILGSIDIKRLLLELAQLESAEMVLGHVVNTLAGSPISSWGSCCWVAPSACCGEESPPPII